MTPLEAALRYAAFGWFVFPLKQKHPLTVHGFKDATRDAATIRDWWAVHPNANIGVRTGAESGIVAVDVDAHKGGLESLKQLGLPVTLTSRTGGGGLHLIYKHPGKTVRNVTATTNNAPLGPGIDIRGDGGYIVVPPSIHENGSHYAWEHTGPAADYPEVLTERLAHRPAPAPTTPVVTTKYPDADPGLLDQARSLLAAHGPAIQGQGGDHHTFRAAAILVHNFALSAEQAMPLFQEWNKDCRPPWSVRDLGAKLEGAARYATGPYGSLRDRPLLIETELTLDDDTEPEFNNATDAGNAEEFARVFADQFRYVPGRAVWLEWASTHWEPDGTGAANRAVLKLAKQFSDQANQVKGVLRDTKARQRELTSQSLAGGTTSRNAEAEIQELNSDVEQLEARREYLHKRSVRLQSAGGIQATLSVAEFQAGLVVPASKLDTQHMLLNVSNGTIDLRTGKLQPHARRDLFTLTAPVVHNPAATCHTWMRFLRDMLATDVVDYLQRAVGYSLTGDVSSQCLFFLYGDGRNGKSTFINVIRALLGGYAKVGADTLLSNGDHHPTQIAMLQGARMVTLNETEEGRAFPASLVKRLTSEESLTARTMGKDFWEFNPTHKLWISGNHKPRVAGTDLGIWRRINLIPWSRVLATEEVDAELPAKLIAELPGILNWAVVGTQAWLKCGLGSSPTIEAATRQYRDSENVYLQFVTETCVVAPGETVDRVALYVAFQNWCIASGMKGVPTRNRFYEELRKMGFLDRKTANKYLLVGLRLAA